jgi:hypothetical protein
MRSRAASSAAQVIKLNRYEINAIVMHSDVGGELKFYKVLAMSRAHALDRLGIRPEQVMLFKENGEFEYDIAVQE